MTADPVQCRRLAALLARMDERDGGPVGTDPSAALTPEELAWAAAHLDGCTRCAHLGDDSVAAIVAALRAPDDVLDAFDEGALAARRAAILTAIREPTARAGAADRVHAAVARPVGGRRDPDVHRTPASRRRAWLASGIALAGATVLVLVSAWPRGDDRPVARVASTPLADFAGARPARDPSELADADDAWLVTGEPLLGADAYVARDRALGDLSDQELDELEGVFVSVAWWS